VLLGPPGTGKTHLAVGLGVKAAHQGHRVLFATATEWVMRLQSAHRDGRLAAQLKRLRRVPLIIVPSSMLFEKLQGRESGSL
jgi:DNA replication protein DnaC